MSQIIQVKTGELAVTHNDNIIKTGSIGSCVVIILYDEVSRIGGLAHALLPFKKNKEETDSEAGQDGKYVDTAIDKLVALINKQGGKTEKLVAKIVGGASMFKKLIDSAGGIGEQNVHAARIKLAQLNIPLVGAETGGSTGRTVEFNLATGLIQVNTII